MLREYGIHPHEVGRFTMAELEQLGQDRREQQRTREEAMTHGTLA
jgi:hypothetical protein